MNAERILLVDDIPANLALLIDALEPRGYELLTAANGEQALKLAERARPDLILLDVLMPGQDGFKICQELRSEESTSDIPVIFITAKHEVASLVRGFQVGAVDYIHKPFRAEEVITRVETHLRLRRLTRELQARNSELELEIKRRRRAETAKEVADERLSNIAAREAERWGLAGFVGESRLLRGILKDVEKLHHFGKTSVLVTGESGTGKELIARAIHHHSPRSANAFVPVNCVAIPGELAESLFFGHVKGSFTGAATDRKGYFELADGGTLFLDEIGDMPPILQAKLLRVLEDGEVTPVGANQARRVDVRVISATNADLQQKIESGEFRRDLYFRLARYSVETAPLRDRPEDVPLLAAHFLEVFSAEMGLPAPPLTRESTLLLQQYSFPGNVRELKNCIERALILSEGRPIAPAHLQLLSPLAPPVVRTTSRQSQAMVETLPLNLEAAEQALIQRALEQSGGNVVEAAKLLGVNRSRIYRRFPNGAEVS